MTIQLPKDVENSINEEVINGHFTSVDDAVTSIVREYFGRTRNTSQDVPSDIQTDTGTIRDVENAFKELEAIRSASMKNRSGESMPEQENTAAPASVPGDRKPIWERIAELRKNVPAEEWDKLPVDGADQLDHYVYGSPKRPTA